MFDNDTTLRPYPSVSRFPYMQRLWLYVFRERLNELRPNTNKKTVQAGEAEAVKKPATRSDNSKVLEQRQDARDRQRKRRLNMSSQKRRRENEKRMERYWAGKTNKQLEDM